MEAVITADHLVKSYGSSIAVDDVSLEVFRGEIYGLVGPNGAGKTSVVEILQGLREPDAGRVSVLGLDPQTEPERLRPQIGSQLQSSALPNRLKVWEALDLFASLSAGGPPWRQMLEDWDLAAKADAQFGALSGGQRQRLLVALALINDPTVVFLDEMTTGLDPAARRRTWELVERIRDEGTTVVLVTHFMDEAERLCDRLAVMKEGEIVAIGSPAELLAEHRAVVTMAFTAESGDLTFLSSVPGVLELGRHGPSVEITALPTAPPHIAHALVERGIVPADMTVQGASLEDVYLDLVGEGPQ